MTHLPQMQQSYQPPLIANENAYLGDVATSRDAEKPSMPPHHNSNLLRGGDSD